MNRTDARSLKFCGTHPKNDAQDGCLSCQFAMHWNLWRQFCACGEPATGYRLMSIKQPVEFFCDDHFQDVPELIEVVGLA